MMSEVLTEEASNTGSQIMTAGSRLRLARQAANLQIQDVANHLRLRADVIENLENDDYRDMPKQVFIRGYLRAYAKLVEIDADDVIDAFNQCVENEDDSMPTSILQDDRVENAGGLSFRWLIGIVFLLIISAVMVWRFNQPQVSKVKVLSMQQRVAHQQIGINDALNSLEHIGQSVEADGQLSDAATVKPDTKQHRA